MKHTKEPWTYYHEKIGDCFVVRSNEQGAIAETFTSSDRDRANAILIAEAPAMLRRLESAARWVGKLAADNDTNYIGGRAHQELERINAVIAKARGE